MAPHCRPVPSNTITWKSAPHCGPSPATLSRQPRWTGIPRLTMAWPLGVKWHCSRPPWKGELALNTSMPTVATGDLSASHAGPSPAYQCNHGSHSPGEQNAKHRPHRGQPWGIWFQWWGGGRVCHRAPQDYFYIRPLLSRPGKSWLTSGKVTSTDIRQNETE